MPAARHPRPRTAQRPRPRITLDQLHTFMAVAENEHVTAAAEALRMSQGSVSAALSRLEETLGLPLFHRVGRNIRLTDVGRALRHLASRTLDDVSAIEELTAGYLAFERGEVTVVAGRVIGTYRLSGWLAPFVRNHPEIAVHLTLAPVQAALDMLETGSADIAVLGSYVRNAGLETMALERTDLVIVVAAQHPLATSTAPLRELHAHRYLAHEQGSATRTRASLALRGHADDSHVIELEEGALMAALLAGIGFAVMPRSLVDAHISHRRLVVLRGSGHPVTQQFTAVRRAALHTPAVHELWRHLATVADYASAHE